jgi:hypothetical protein
VSTIVESDMVFGEYEEDNLFEIEKSNIYANVGSGIKTVEFILKHKENDIIFLEAKKSCPNAQNRYESDEKEEKFEEYYSSITDKFVDSLQIYLAALMNKYADTSEIGINLMEKNLKNINFKFVLVIKSAEDLSWLAGPMAILKDRLMHYRKIWNIEVAVLNPELARNYNLLVD